MTSLPDSICRVLVRGRVQGVGFRAWVERAALSRGLVGWVRNRADGSVEAVFAGPSADVEAMIAACRKGPRASRVDALDQQEGSVADLAMRRPGELFSVLATI